MATFQPDADLADADWAKRGAWDLPDDPDYWRTAPIGQVERIARLPAFEQAPEAVAEIVQERLAAETD